MKNQLQTDPKHREMNNRNLLNTEIRTLLVRLSLALLLQAHEIIKIIL